MYSKVVLNVFNNPKNVGRIMKPDGIASNYNADNTANVEFSMRVNGGIISDCKFRAQANPYIIAICSTITEMLKGKMTSLLFIDPYTVTKNLGADENIDFTFCIDCVKMMIEDYSIKLEKAQKLNEVNKVVPDTQNTTIETDNTATKNDFEDDFFDEDFI